MDTHVLKTDPDVFQESWNGRKLYEIRKDDRNFKVGDELYLRETKHSGEEMEAGAPLIYTGREIRCIVWHKLKNRYGLQDGWCILGVGYRRLFESTSPASPV